MRQDDATPCDALQLEPGLVLAVVDSSSGAPVASASSVVARAGLYFDTATTVVNGTYYLLYERPGTYSLSVQHTGYRDWQRDSVSIPTDGCHVKTLNLTVRLQL